MKWSTHLLVGSVCASLLAFAVEANAQVTYQPGPNNPNPSNESASGTGIPALQAQVVIQSELPRTSSPLVPTSRNRVSLSQRLSM